MDKPIFLIIRGLGRSPKRGEGGSLTLSPGTDAGRVCPKALHDAEPTKHTQPFTTGKGFGVRDREFALSYKNRLFLQAEIRQGVPVGFVLYALKIPFGSVLEGCTFFILRVAVKAKLSGIIGDGIVLESGKSS